MIPVTTLRPFTRMLMTIGQIPTSYLISMTYEEQLLWLCNYLEKEVIPALNNNAEAVKEVQDLYVELKSYVDNYFENLDVQEEINNKLDEMAEGGQLADIIAQYVQLTSTYTYDTISDLKSATNLFDGANVRTNGYYSIGDDGGALYHVREILNSDVIDEGSIIALDDNTLIAELIPFKITTRMFGCKITSGQDDTNALQNAINYCENKKLYFTSGTYEISNTIDLSNNDIIGENVTIKCNDSFSNNNMTTVDGYVYVKGIIFDANGKAISIIPSSTTNTKLIVDSCTFKNCKANANDNNFALNSAVYLSALEGVIENSTFKDNYAHGLRLYAQTSGSVADIHNCLFDNNGITIAACGLCEYNRDIGERYDRVNINNCVATNNYASGFAIHSAKNSTTTNCIADNNGEHGFVLMDGENGIITNCVAIGSNNYGIRVQGDYSSGNQGYEDFIISNNIIKGSSGIYLDNNIKKGIIANNLIDSDVASTYGIRIGRSDNLTDTIKDIKIVDNTFTGEGIYYNNNISTAFVLNETNYIKGNKFNNKVADRYFIDGNRKNSYISTELKYSNVSNNLNTNPSSLSGWSGTITDNEVTPSGNNLIRKSFAVSGVPQWVSITLDKNSYSSKFSIGLRFRDSGSSLITFTDDGGASSNQITQLSQFNANLITKVFDLEGYVFASPVAYVEVYLTVDSGTTEHMTINNIYCSLSNENTIINSVKTL